MEFLCPPSLILFENFFLSFCLYDETRRDEEVCWELSEWYFYLFYFIFIFIHFSAFYETGVRNAALKCVFIVNNVIQANKLLQVKKNPIDPLVLSAIVCKAALEGCPVPRPPCKWSPTTFCRKPWRCRERKGLIQKFGFNLGRAGLVRHKILVPYIYMVWKIRNSNQEVFHRITREYWFPWLCVAASSRVRAVAQVLASQSGLSPAS